MKRDFSKVIFVLFLALSFCLFNAGVSLSQDVVDIIKEGDGSLQPSEPPPDPVEFPIIALYDNGPLITHPGGGAGGADASALQTTLGMNTYGFGHQFSLGYRVADDFIVTSPGGMQINEIIFFAYQTGSPTSPSTITGVYYQIWDGPPNNPGSSVVFGDLTTNRLTNTTWSNIYRVLDTDLSATNRPIMANTASAGVWLPQGTYWLDWMTDGSLSSGPWAPPITILGQTTTGNALQFTSSWDPVLDSGTGTQQGFPFIIPGAPDLVVSYLSAKIQKIGSLIGRVLVQYRVKNVGDAGAGGSWIAFYLSKDTVLDASDVYLGDAYIPPLAPGQEAPLPVGTKGFRLNNPVFWQVPSTWYVIAVADAWGFVDESDETNNRTSTVATIVVK